MTKVKMDVYPTKRSPEWLKDNPNDAYQCDIYPGDGTDHHGRAATPHEAAFFAVSHWCSYEHNKTQAAEKPETALVFRRSVESAPGEFVDATCYDQES